MHVAFKVIEGKQAGNVIPLTRKKFLIGREEDCHLRPNSDLVSRHHCVITIDDFTVRIRDLGSTNGTFVNGKRIAAPVELKHGDEVRIGKLAFSMQIQTAQPESTPAPAPAVAPPTVADLPTPAASASETISDLRIPEETFQQSATPYPGQYQAVPEAVQPAAMPQQAVPPGYPMGYPAPGYPMMPGYLPPGYYPQPGYPMYYPAPGVPTEPATQIMAGDTTMMNPMGYPGYPMPYPPQQQMPQQQMPAQPAPQGNQANQAQRPPLPVRLPDPTETGAPPPSPAGTAAPTTGSDPSSKSSIANSVDPRKNAADVIRNYIQSKK